MCAAHRKGTVSDRECHAWTQPRCGPSAAHICILSDTFSEKNKWVSQKVNHVIHARHSPLPASLREMRVNDLLL